MNRAFPNTADFSNNMRDRFNFASPLSGFDMQDAVSDTAERVRDVTNFNIDFENPFSHVGEFVSDVSQSFEDRPAPDFSLPEFSLDSSTLFQNSNDNFDNSWLTGGDSVFDRSDSLFSDSQSDFGGDFHSSDSFFEF